MKTFTRSVSVFLCFTLLSYFVMPGISFAQIEPIVKNYTNTVSIIKDARISVSEGKLMYALALYKYADQVVDEEKEPILKRKIMLEREQTQRLVDEQIEKQKIEKIRGLIAKGIEQFKSDKLPEAKEMFQQVLTLDETNKEAKNYLEKVIPLRESELKNLRQLELEKKQMKQIKELYIKARIYFKEDELEEADKLYNQILNIDLDQTEAQNFVEVIIPREMKTRPQRILAREERKKKLAEIEAKIKAALEKEIGQQRIAEKRESLKKANKGLAKRQKNKKPAVLKDLNAPKVMVTDIQFSGNTIFDEKTLKPIVLPAIGKELSLEQLKAVSEQIQNFYRDGGYFLAQVIIPEQNIQEQNGLVKMTVLEGKLGELKVHGQKRFKEKRVRQVLSQIRPDEPVRKQNVERGLLVLNSYAGVKTSSILQAGKEPGTTDINVEVKESRRIKGNVTVDNTGLKSTGKYHITTALEFPNLTGRGDALGAKWMNSLNNSDLYFGQVNYETPLFSKGLKLKGYYSRGKFAVGEEFASLDIESKTQSWGSGFSYPVYLSQRTSITSEVWYESKDFKQTLFNGDLTTVDDRIRKIRVEIMNLDTQDLKGRTIAGFGVHQGIGDNAGAMAKDSLLSSRSFAKADNDFTKITPSLLRAQSLTDKWMLIGRLSGQYAFDPLVAGEQWAIGGMNSVHGHQTSAFLGDDGYTTNLESRYTLLTTKHSKYELLIFGDQGTVYTKKPAFRQKHRKTIAGTGVGIYADFYDALDVRLDWGFPIGPVTSDKSIFYFEVKYSF